MEEEVQGDKLYCLRSKDNDLHFLKEIVQKNDIYILEKLDIEPFVEFSLDFSAEYWYLKCHLLRDKRVLISLEDSVLFDEKDLNVVFFKLSDLKNFLIECVDGKWFFKIILLNDISEEVFNILKANNCF